MEQRLQRATALRATGCDFPRQQPDKRSLSPDCCGYQPQTHQGGGWPRRGRLLLGSRTLLGDEGPTCLSILCGAHSTVLGLGGFFTSLCKERAGWQDILWPKELDVAGDEALLGFREASHRGPDAVGLNLFRLATPLANTSSCSHSFWGCRKIIEPLLRCKELRQGRTCVALRRSLRLIAAPLPVLVWCSTPRHPRKQLGSFQGWLGSCPALHGPRARWGVGGLVLCSQGKLRCAQRPVCFCSLFPVRWAERPPVSTTPAIPCCLLAGLSPGPGSDRAVAWGSGFH